MSTTRVFLSRDGSMCRMAVAWCGCSDDWAVIDPDKVPTDFDNGVYAHGFDSEAEAAAAAYIRDFDPMNPLAWKIVETDDDPFDLKPFERETRIKQTEIPNAGIIVVTTRLTGPAAAKPFTTFSMCDSSGYASPIAYFATETEALAAHDNL